MDEIGVSMLPQLTAPSLPPGETIGRSQSSASTSSMLPPLEAGTSSRQNSVQMQLDSLLPLPSNTGAEDGRQSPLVAAPPSQAPSGGGLLREGAHEPLGVDSAWGGADTGNGKSSFLSRLTSVDSAGEGTTDESDNEMDSDSEKAQPPAKPMRLSRSLSGYDTREDRLLVRLGSLVQGSEAAFYKLMSASAAGDAKAARRCLEQMSVEAASQLNPVKDAVSYGLSALHIATSVEVCRLLVDHGVDVDIRGLNGQTPLHTATHNDNLDIIRYLLDAGADVNARTTYNGSTPLQWATAADNKRVVKVLVRAGADVCFCNFSGNTALHLATSVDVAKYLVSKGARMDVTNDDGRLPLEEAALRASSDEEHRVALYLLDLSKRLFRSQDNHRVDDLHVEATKADAPSSVASDPASGDPLLRAGSRTSYGSSGTASSSVQESSNSGVTAKLQQRMLQQNARNKWTVLKRAFLTGRRANPEQEVLPEYDENGASLADVYASRSSSFYEAFFNVIVRERPSLALKILDQQRNFLHWENNAQVFSYNISLLGTIPHSSFALKEMVFTDNAELISHRVVQFVLNARWTLFTREVVFFEFLVHVAFTGLLVYSVFSAYRVLPYGVLASVWREPSLTNVMGLVNLIAHVILFALNARYTYIHVVQARLADMLSGGAPRWSNVLHCKLRNEAFFIVPHVAVFGAQLLRAIPRRDISEDGHPDIALIVADVLSAVVIPRLFYRGLGFGEGFESIGVPMATIRRMISRNIVYFLVLFTLITGFSLSMAVLFKDEQSALEYNSVGMSWINLFMFIFNLDVTTLNEDSIFWRKWFAFLVLAVYMVLVSLVVVNLLVAVMTNTYEEISENSQAAWMMQKARLVLFYEHYEMAVNSIIFSKTAAQIAKRSGRYIPPGDSNQYVREMVDDSVEVELPRSYIEELAVFRKRNSHVFHRVRTWLFALYNRVRGSTGGFTWPKVDRVAAASKALHPDMEVRGHRSGSGQLHFEPVDKEFGAALSEKSELQLITVFHAPRSQLDGTSGDGVGSRSRLFSSHANLSSSSPVASKKDIEDLALSVKELILSNRRLEREVVLLRARSHGLSRSTSTMPQSSDGLLKTTSVAVEVRKEAGTKGPSTKGKKGNGGDGNSSEGDEDEAPSVSFRGLFKYADWLDVLLGVAGVICGAGTGVALPLFSILLGGLVDDFNGGDVLGAGAHYAKLFAWIALGAFACGAGQVAFFTILSERITLRIRKLYLASILRQEVAWFDTSNPGQLSSKIAENTVVIRDGLGDKLGAMFQFIAMFLAGYVVGFVYSWKLTLVILAVAPLLAAGGFMMMKLMADATSGGLGAYARAGAVAEEAFSLVRTIQSYSIENRTVERYNDELKHAEDNGIKKSRAQGFGMGFTFGIYFGCYALAFWFGTVLVFKSGDQAADDYPFDASLMSDPSLAQYCEVDRTISWEQGLQLGCQVYEYDEPSFTFANAADVCSCTMCNCGCNREGVDAGCINGGDILACFFSIIIGSMAIGQAAPGITSLTNARAAAGKIFQVIDREPEIDASGTPGDEVNKSTLVGKYRLENVTFRYPARKDVLIFNGVNLEIEPNKTTALVGGSGCGKSTVTQLLMRFYDPEGGKITLDGRDIREFNVASLRAQIGLVGQEPVLFATTIADNIAQGAAPGVEVTRQEIEDAARAANAFDFISELPEGFDTFVGERGSSLSGGQKQRIAIARAIIRDPSTLILDEATSALDSESERIVQRALDDLLRKRSRTTVVIAHRLSTIRNADKIVVLGANAGGVLEQGSHSELLALDGMYSALVAAAQRSQEGENGEESGEVDIQALMSSDDKVQQRFGSHLSAASGPREGSGSFREGSGAISASKARSGNSLMAGDARASRGASAAGMPAANKSAMKTNEVAPHEEDVDSDDESSGDGSAKGKKKKKKKELYKVSTRRLFAYSAPEKLLYVPAMLAACVNGVIMPLFGILFSGIATVYYFPTQDIISEEANFYVYFFIGLAVLTGIGYWAQFTYFGIIGERMTTRVRLELFRAALRQEIGFFDERKNSVGALTSKLASDASVVKASVTDRMGLAVMNSVTAISGIVIGFVFCWQLTLALVAMLPIIIVGAGLQLIVMSGLAKEDDVAMAEAGQTLTEAIYGIRTVTAFGLRTRVINLYDKHLVGPSKLGVKKGISGGLGFGFSQCVIFMVYGVAFFYASRLIANEGYTFRDVFTSVMTILMVGFGIGQSAAMTPDIAKASVGVSNVFSIIDRKSKIDASDSSGLKDEAVTSEDIDFSAVNFAYPTRPDALVYENMSLNIKGGSTVALVGASGSGKSTCVGLVERFYDAASGSVKIRGVEAKDANVAWLRQQIGFVQQEGQLFATTIFENIAYGIPAGADGDNTPVTQEMVEAAAKRANAHDFIMEFPDGYQTDVGPQGSQLSGGQRQRICLARCLMRRPKILLLDEATSALDNESQRIVQDTLDTMIEELQATTLIVAHRLTTIQNADKIVVFSHGVPVEQGTHDELLANKDGAYTALWNAQEGTSE
ncbi:ABC transporter B family member 11 [Hondaea fermentalgiana]|uniref:ABC transporter B family member 11 n=1 Tax=Hondaea fermentalgiana TaxID=2315210 RepID=A0A2R5GGM7_9STRA|nr:ABC transporter B family member 11 [Hondaea fermentalgiana]|eukprot:GBG27421.1 ABC transporter B family member 11 [Hondaea fermentalgiana]